MGLRTVFFLPLACVLQAAGAVPTADQLKLLANFENLQDFISSGRSVEKPAAEKVRVKTHDGTFIVERMENKGASWLRARGIQYAEHPVGSLRWQPPVPKKPDFTHDIDATQWVDDCVQGPYLSKLMGVKGHPTSESCLYLNLWAPHNATAEKKESWPVLFWMHGGSFTMGGSTGYNVDGIFSFTQNAIVVTTNYRLGILGFLGGKKVAESTIDGSMGNFGLQDTRMAMKWVQQNIASFSGDPNRVTIYGESSGASFVETHISAPRSNGLFQNAIMQSGAFDNYTMQLTPDSLFADFAFQAGCNPEAADVMQCLRKMPLWGKTPGDKAIMPALSNQSRVGALGPCIDNVELTEAPWQSAEGNRLNKVTSAIIGTNLDEGRFLMPLQMPVPNGPLATRADLQEWLETYYPYAPQEIAKRYSFELNAFTPWETAAVIFTDSQYVCPTQRSARWLTAAGMDTFVYRLEYAPSTFYLPSRIMFLEGFCSDFSWCKNISLADPGVGHSADVYLLFNDPRMNATDHRVSHTMLNYWANFAGSANPSGGVAKVPSWPSFLPGNITMRIGEKSGAKANLRQSYCDFWAHTPSGWLPVPPSPAPSARAPSPAPAAKEPVIV